MFAGVGERTREGNDLYKEMIESVRARGQLAPASQAQHGCEQAPDRQCLQRCQLGLNGTAQELSRADACVQGVNKLGDKIMESKCALVYGQMNEPPGARARVALTGLTVAEYFRDQMGQDVLFFVDNIFRFTQVRWPD